MASLYHLSIYILVGTIGGFLVSRTKLPAGTLIGAVFAIIFFKMVVHESWAIPKRYGFICQIALGVLIASTYEPGMYHRLGHLIYPMFISTISLVVVGLLVSVLLTKLHILDFPTAYIATSPGAMNALVPLALDLDANAALVAHFHFFRIFFVAATAPVIFRFFVG